LQVGAPGRLALIWCGAGGRDEEREMHDLLEPAHLRGEWFSNQSPVVNLALVVLPVIGARGLIELGRDGLLTFVPNHRQIRMVNFCGLAHHARKRYAGGNYWPPWAPVR